MHGVGGDAALLGELVEHALDVVPPTGGEVVAHEVGRQAPLPGAVSAPSRQSDAVLDRLQRLLQTPGIRQQVREVHARSERAALDARLLGEHERLAHQAQALVAPALQEETLVDQCLHDHVVEPEPLGEVEGTLDVRHGLVGATLEPEDARELRTHGRDGTLVALGLVTAEGAVEPRHGLLDASRDQEQVAESHLRPRDVGPVARLLEDGDCLLQQSLGLVHAAAHDGELAGAGEGAPPLDRVF